MARVPSTNLKNHAGYGTGAGYTLTNSSAQVLFAAVNPIITLTVAGVWLIQAQAKLNASADVINAQGKVVTVKLRRTNNTASDLTNGQMTLHIPLTTAEIIAVGEISKTIIYTAAKTNDSISLFADIDATPSTGSITIASASIIALKIG